KIRKVMMKVIDKLKDIAQTLFININIINMNLTMKKHETGVARVVYWASRVLGILAILFISLFALDAFGSGLSIWQQIGGFLIHMIPSLALATLWYFIFIDRFDIYPHYLQLELPYE
ncbi:MAG: hypothetical protein MUF39_06395, partial [Cyclobacteriaceae bacterium]|nr:hypothetical protein [Cyclobacteriaceae bacterium]